MAIIREYAISVKLACTNQRTYTSPSPVPRRRLPSGPRQRIDKAILALAEDPRPAGCKPMKDALRGTYRVRVGTYRMIHTVLDAEGVVVVARVRKRDESTYRGL